MTQVKRWRTTMWMMYSKSNTSLWLLQVGNVCKWPLTTQWGEEKCPSLTFLRSTSSLKTILTDDWCSDGKMRWRVPSAGELWDGDRLNSQMGRDHDSTLVLCESTSCMLMTSVLTPLSYTGLSKADSSVMFSYGGKDEGILMDFPWSLSRKRRSKAGDIM